MRARKRRRGDLSMAPSPNGDAAATSSKIEEAMWRTSSRRIATWPDCDAWRPKSMFDLYYKLQKIVGKADW